MKTKINKFYVGHEGIAGALHRDENHSYTRPTLDAAIADAKARLTLDSGLKQCIIVRIVRIVKRADAPITVEVVR